MELQCHFHLYISENSMKQKSSTFWLALKQYIAPHRLSESMER